jgi:hypothetical protein
MIFPLAIQLSESNMTIRSLSLLSVLIAAGMDASAASG